MSIIEKIREKAKLNLKTIVLPEGSEKRTVQAAAYVKRNRIAEPVLLGNRDSIFAAAKETGSDIDGIVMVDPDKSNQLNAYASALYEARKSKGMTTEEALKLALDPMYFGIMMVRQGDADGLVSGAVHTTGDMLRPALQLIKTKPGCKVVSSSFLMDCYSCISKVISPNNISVGIVRIQNEFK